jgi:hypothetical protein
MGTRQATKVKSSSNFSLGPLVALAIVTCVTVVTLLFMFSANQANHSNPGVGGDMRIKLLVE